MKQLFLLFCGAMLLALASCHTKKEKTEAAVSADTIEVAVQVPDSTIYGVATEDFGMSTFAIMKDGTDSIIYVNRTHDDGSEGQIYGDIQPDDRYAMTTADGGQSLDRAINLTQVELFTTDYSVCNAKLVLNPKTEPDTVEIVSLSEEGLVAKGKKEYNLKKQHTAPAQK